MKDLRYGMKNFYLYIKNKEINISYVSENSTALAYGSKEEGYVCMDFNSPEAFIQARIFDGKSIYDIWDELS